MSKTFSGGIRFSREQAPLLERPEASPNRLSFLLPEGQLPILSSESLVGEGGLLAEATETQPALFSAITGKLSIEDRDGGTRLFVKAQDNETELQPLAAVTTPLAELSSDTIAEHLRRGGVCLPTREEKRKLLIVDCGGGPYNASRIALSETYPDELVGGAKILMKYFGIRRCLFAIPSSARSTAQGIEERLPHRSSMLKIVLVKNKYPQSEEHLLVSALCNTEIHVSKPTADAGYRVISPQLCVAVFRVLAYGTPLLSVPVTVTDRNGEMRVASLPLGTHLCDIPALLGIAKEENDLLLSAEGIYGHPIDEKATVTLSTEAIRLINADAKEAEKHEKISPCIGCRRCVKVCPTHLMPLMLYRAIGEDDAQRIEALDLDGCLLCGCCSAVCPSSLPLAESFAAYRHPKGEADHDR